MFRDNQRHSIFNSIYQSPATINTINLNRLFKHIIGAYGNGFPQDNKTTGPAGEPGACSEKYRFGVMNQG
jgi:hypothetical protein